MTDEPIALLPVPLPGELEQGLVAQRHEGTPEEADHCLVVIRIPHHAERQLSDGPGVRATFWAAMDDPYVLLTALDEERRSLIRANEERLTRYLRAAEAWAAVWPGVQREIEGLPLPAAHEVVTARAERSLPFAP